MAKISVKNLGEPDERRPFADKGYLEVVKFGDGMIGRGVFEPGWRWSKHVKPIAGTGSCEAAHCGYVISGSMHVQMDDGETADIGPGDFVVIPPGHDAWVTGNEPCVLFDFAGYTDYARPKAGAEKLAVAEQGRETDAP